MGSSIRAVFLDIDNTLTSPVTRNIPRSAVEAVRLARANDVKVFAATGRNTRAKEEGAILEGLELDGCVAVNGQLCCLTDGSIVHLLPLDTEDAEAAYRFCLGRDIPVIVSGVDGNRITGVNDTVLGFHEELKIPLCPLERYATLRGMDVLSLSPFMGAEEERALLSLLKRSDTVRFDPRNLDVIPRGGGKDTGIERVLAHFGIPLSQSLAMGDGGNDITMLRAAGVGVAMAGSAKEVLDAADDVAPPPDEDGVWRTFERYGII